MEKALAKEISHSPAGCPEGENAKKLPEEVHILNQIFEIEVSPSASTADYNPLGMSYAILNDYEWAEKNSEGY
jgi:hypothetical protein